MIQPRFTIDGVRKEKERLTAAIFLLSGRSGMTVPSLILGFLRTIQISNIFPCVSFSYIYFLANTVYLKIGRMKLYFAWPSQYAAISLGNAFISLEISSQFVTKQLFSFNFLFS
jgi:hypothetical protein